MLPVSASTICSQQLVLFQRQIRVQRGKNKLYLETLVLSAQKPEDLQSQMLYYGLFSQCYNEREDSVGGSGNWIESSQGIFLLTGDSNCKVTGQDSSCGDFFVLFIKSEGRAHCGLPHTKVLTYGQKQPG